MNIQDIINTTRLTLFSRNDAEYDSADAAFVSYIQECVRGTLEELYLTDLSFVSEEKLTFTDGRAPLTDLSYTPIEPISLKTDGGCRLRVRVDSSYVLSDGYDGDALLRYRAKYDVPTMITATLKLPPAYTAEVIKLGACYRYALGRGLVDEGNYYRKAYEEARSAILPVKEYEKTGGRIKGRCFR